jgi:hypothetical protein
LKIDSKYCALVIGGISTSSTQKKKTPNGREMMFIVEQALVSLYAKPFVTNTKSWW